MKFSSLPSTILDYIYKNCDLKLSQKLMKSCKALRLQQIRVGKCHLKSLKILKNGHEFNMDSYKFEIKDTVPFWEVHAYGPKLLFGCNMVKVWDSLILRYFHIDKVNSMLPKLDITELKELNLAMHFAVTNETFTKLFQPSIRKVDLFLPSQPNGKVYEIAFENLKNADDIKIHGSLEPPLLSHAVFKNLISIERKTKFVKCELSFATLDITVDDIILLVQNYMQSKGRFILWCRGTNVPWIRQQVENHFKLMKQKSLFIPKVYIYPCYNDDAENIWG